MSKRYTGLWKLMAERWDRFYDPPGRPCRDDVKEYKRYLKKAIKAIGKKRIKALVIGATPELRDILAEAGADVTLIDINKEMLEAMTKLRKTRGKERMIAGNWVRMPFKNNEFDVVIGDLVFPNVPRKDQPKFFREVSRVLKDKGYFIHRVYLVRDNFKREGPEKIIQRYARYPYRKILHSEMFEALLDNTYDFKKNIADCSKVGKIIGKYMYEEGKFRHPSKKVSKMLWMTYMAWKPFNKEWCTYKDRKASRLVEKNFRILEKAKPARQHRFPNFRVWFCQKRWI